MSGEGDNVVNFGCLAALPTFLAESDIGSGAFSSKAHARDGSVRERQLRYLASHQYDVEFGGHVFPVLTGGLQMVLEIALSLIGRGLWTIPSWQVEQALAERAQSRLQWIVSRAFPPESGDLVLRLGTHLRASDYGSLLALSPLEGERARPDIITFLCDLVDKKSPGELTFVREVAANLPIALLCMLQPQRDVASMGLDPEIFADQRVDFAFETPEGLRLVVEIDGSQHVDDAAQAHLDQVRDAALLSQDWATWRIPTYALRDSTTLRLELERRLKADKYDDAEINRNADASSLFWAATAVVRIQALVLEAIVVRAIPSSGPIRVAVTEYHTDVADLAIADLSNLLSRLGSLYQVDVPGLIVEGAGHCDLLVDIDVLHPLRPPPRSSSAMAWSRPAARAVKLVARRIPVGSDSPRFMPALPDSLILGDFVRDLFRKNGFRCDHETGQSDQAAITLRILQGQSVVGLLPTGAGKSLPYMLAGLLLPGMTLYVGPLISLLQDQAERLRESGISHVESISSAQDHVAREDALARVQSQGVRFLLVSPERFLTAGFLDALNNRALWHGDISQVVIDECHCVSEWGHEFRPAYLSLGRIAKNRSKRFGAHAPLVALTGTASTVVLSDVLRELGITDPDACIRAANLDRPELTMRCTRVVAPENREKQIEESSRNFLSNQDGNCEGLLVFCPFRGGRTTGVFSVAAHLSRTLPGIDVRFYCGGEEPWREYAVYAQRRRAADLTDNLITQAVPTWGRTASGVKLWAEVKAEVQRDFVSGTKRNFRVLVATKAFGMGIDKPSIRKIIHAVAPTSPEAFYQEIGRAGRDRMASEAELMFCDIEQDVTNRILDPSLDHDEAIATYNSFIQKDKFGGGDFLRTFYFHGQAFQGMEPAAQATFLVAKIIHNAVAENKAPCIPFELIEPMHLGEKDVEYGLVRLIHLGVVEGYLKDYNRRVFRVDLVDDWLAIRTSKEDLADYLANRFADFIRRYHLTGGAEQVNHIREQRASLKDLYDTVSRQMMIFIYQQLERQRRAATRAMLEIARVGLGSADQMRHRLLNYLQVSLRFTAMLEGMTAKASSAEWLVVLKQALSPQDLAELHGSAQRVLASFPTHPGLLFLSAVSRPMQTDDDPRRSEEEFVACVRHAPDHAIALTDILQALRWFEGAELLQKADLRVPVARICGRIHLDISSDIDELAPYLFLDDVRDDYIARLIRKAADSALLP